MFEPEERIELAEYTTFGVGGTARYFHIADTIKGINEGVLFARANGLPVQVLGEGSNVLISDAGIDSFVLKINTKGVEFELLGGQTRVIAQAGEKFDDVVSLSVEKGLYGIENLSSIPGTVGASPVHNIGAYGVEVSDVIEWVEVLNIDTGVVGKLSNTECDFKYRSSVFKDSKNLIILRVSFLLDNNYSVNIEYKDIKDFLNKDVNPTLNDMRNAIVHIRKQKFPDTGTAGSFFKNPIVSKSETEKLLSLYPDLVIYPHGKLSAAWLIDKVGGWKGYSNNGAGVSDVSALVLVNHGNAKSRDVFDLAEEIRKDIREKTNINLEYEVNLLGDF